MLLNRNYHFVSRNCYNIHQVVLVNKPIVGIRNTAITMIANAASIRCILPGTPAFELREGPLDMMNMNETILRSLRAFSVQMDDERYEFNNGHWRCHFETIEMEDAGNVVMVKPVPSKNRMRNGSATVIHFPDDVHHGTVKGYPTGETVSLKLLGSRISEVDTVMGIDVERYNELNIKLLENNRLEKLGPKHYT